MAWRFFHDEGMAKNNLSLLSRDLYQSFKEDLTGGPVIVFRRIIEIGKSIIKQRRFRRDDGKGEVANRLIAFDVNALC